MSTEPGAGHNNELIEKLAAVPTDQYYELIKSKTGDELAKIIFSAPEYRKIANASDAMRDVVRRMEEALRRIGTESKLNAARIRRYGVTLSNTGV